MSKHTPGPWVVREDDDGNEGIVKAKYVAAWSHDEWECYFEDVFGNVYDRDVFTHYTPMPEFEVKGGEA